MILYYLFFFIIGTCYASFFVTIGQRWAGQNCHCSRSQCPFCHHVLRWWQLIPLVGWAWQAGRCRDCQKLISPFSSVCELLCGACFTIMAQWPLVDWCVIFVTSASLLVMSATDWQAQWISPLCLTGLFPLYHLFGQLPLNEVIFGIIPLSVLLAIAAKQGLLGAGDCEFLVVLLISVGPFHAAVIVMIASLAFLIYVSVTGNWQKRLPFIPWLSLGTTYLFINQVLK